MRTKECTQKLRRKNGYVLKEQKQREMEQAVLHDIEVNKPVLYRVIHYDCWELRNRRVSAHDLRNAILEQKAIAGQIDLSSIIGIKDRNRIVWQECV